MKSDVYQIVTDRIIQLLQAGTVPWRQPWKGQPPQNLISRKPYRGINAFLLNAARYASPFWLTWKQVQALGGKVRKGEHSFPVVFWKVFTEEGEGETKRFPFLRYYSVFNATQCEGLTLPATENSVVAFEPITRCEQVVSEMPKRPLIHHGGNRACYSPVTDEISLPDGTAFTAPADYYSTLFHELTHATGHSSRLNRKEVAEPIRFGSDPYSREELVAEMGAAFLCGHCAIENGTLEQSAAYVQHWLARLKEDRKLVVHAAAQAQKACDFIRGEQLAEGEVTSPEPVKEAPTMVLNEAPLPYGRGQFTPPPSARRLKIEAAGDFAAGRVRPKIRLTGKWLERAGFSPGEHVQVSLVAPGVMQLCAAATSRSEPF